jgi:hypothetical protein
MPKIQINFVSAGKVRQHSYCSKFSGPPSRRGDRRIVYLPVMRARERAACHQAFIVEEAQWREALAFRRWCLAP